MISDPETVSSRERFSDFVGGLRENLRNRPEVWENATLDSFLEAMERYSGDVAGYLANSGSKIDPETPSWELFALILEGASIYE